MMTAEARKEIDSPPDHNDLFLPNRFG